MSCLTFIGAVDSKAELPEKARLGDTIHVIYDKSTYVYTGSCWESMGYSDLEEPHRATEVSSPIEPKAQICTQCSGRLELDKFGRLVCPYCGTLYRF